MAEDLPTADAEGYGLKLRTKGYRGIPWLLVAILVGSVAWMLYMHDKAGAAAQTETNLALRELVVIAKLNICMSGFSDERKSSEFENPNSRCWTLAKMK